MNPEINEALITGGMLFCRLGACFMLLPGISSERLPPTLRLFSALTVTLVLYPVLKDTFIDAVRESGSQQLLLAGSESLKGLYLGFMVRLFYLGLEFSALTMANCAGYGSIFSHAIDDNHATGPFSELMTLTAVVLFFSTDLHIAVISMLCDSYTSMPAGSGISSPIDMVELTSEFSRSFTLALRLSAPFIIVSITLNLAFGLLNKLVPQIPVYFISVPFSMAAGLFILLRSENIITRLFTGAIGDMIGRLAGHG